MTARRFPCRWALLTVCVLFAPAPARAADDAGTQSVFATGAGNRALAMGGAFVAAADDASAMIWNPAGLALVSRAQGEVVQSGDLGLGMSDSYAALAWPSWRWGTLGMSLRHFGVGGIERRDARNQLLADDLSDSETELAIGYGRALGEAWQAGGTLKLQRQSLAGFAGSGLGVDLGVTTRPAVALGLAAPWAQGVSFGLSLRNAVAPGIRLDRESVPDPTQLRTGLAWRGAAPAGGGLLAELDLTRAPGVSPRLEAGLEYCPLPAAALRVGLHAGALTAGTGLRWRDVSLDYAFGDNALGSTHRAGLTFRFGATTSESRLAHQRLEDQRIAQRLAEGFRTRQDEQVSALFARAADARTRGDLDDALEALALVATLDPERPGRQALEAACHGDRARLLERSLDFAAAALSWDRALLALPGDTAAIAGAARCRDESDRIAKRTSALRERFARAMDAFAGGDLAGARSGFAAIVAAEPADREARRMLERTEQALARAQAQAQLVRPVRVPAPADTARARPRPAVPAGPRLSDREIAELYQRGLAALRARQDEDALRYLELVWSSRPDYRDAAAYLKREYLTRGMEAFAAGRLDDAIALWQRVLRVDPADARARGYLERVEKQRERSREILGVRP